MGITRYFNRGSSDAWESLRDIASAHYVILLLLDSQRLYTRALYTYTLSNGTYLHSQNIKLTHKVYFQYAIHYKRHHMNRKEHGYYSPRCSRKYIKSAV
jgi:hypothetical protein